MASEPLTATIGKAGPLSADRLYRSCDLSRLTFATTAELEPIDGMIGHVAMSALQARRQRLQTVTVALRFNPEIRASSAI
jgi:hypothetical protein